jgi:hypothetical protein
VGDQVDQRGFFALRRRLEQFDQFGGLLRSQRERRDAEGGAFGNVGTVGFKHGESSVLTTSMSRISVVTLCVGTTPQPSAAAAISHLARTIRGCSNCRALHRIARHRAVVGADEIHQAEIDRLDRSH